MTAAVQRLMSSFESLSRTEQQQAIAEILRRAPVNDGDVSDEGLSEIADDLFRSLDADEEAERARS